MPQLRAIPLDQLQQFTAINVLSDPGAIPGPVVVPDCIQVILKYTLTNSKVATIVTYGRVATSFQPSVAIAGALFTAFVNGTGFVAWRPLAPTTAALAGVVLRDVRAPNLPLISSTGAAVAGTSASPGLPDEVALTATLRTARVGQAYRGRMYFPGWATNALGSNGVAAPAAVTAVANMGNDWRSVLAGQSMIHVLGLRARAQYTSPSTGRVHPARAATSETVTSAECRDNHWDSQRRRGLK